MRTNTSVALGPYFEQFVENKISEGRYKNASEVIRAGLRLLEREDAQYRQWAQWATAEIEKGEASGIATEVDFDELLVKFKANRAVKLRNGKD